jgi:hypothetical protein
MFLKNMLKKKNFLWRNNPFLYQNILFIMFFFLPLLYNNGYALTFEESAAVFTEDTIAGRTVSEQTHVLNVYLDCSQCDFDFIRTELNFVNYVRDPELANLHVFVTDEITGGGGREYLFTFIGRGPFNGTSYTLKHHIDRNATLSERREALKQFLKMGFASYLFQTPHGKQFSIQYRGDHEGFLPQQTEDPWNYWVFQAYVGQVRLDLESHMSVLNSRWGLFADRVTEQWKLRFRPYFNYGRVKIQTSGNTVPVLRTQRRHGIDSYAIKSLTTHFSAGIFGTYLTNNGQNLRHQIIFSPGIEFSLFPYEVATRKSIAFTYFFNAGYHEYFQETIYGKNEETLYSQSLKGVVNVKQPWGSIETGLVASHYFHNPDRRRFEFYGQTSVRIFEGLSLSFQAEYNVVRDQLSLPKGSASIEDVLLKQRELATDFSFTGAVAITYTFGSRYANVVNTRF